MHQDASGFVWLGTTDGIARYDGRNWRTFYSSVTGHSINTLGIVEAPNGDLWVGSEKGLKRYVLARGTFEDATYLPVEDTVFPFHIAGDTLWVLTEQQGLMSINRKTHQGQRHHPPGIPNYFRRFTYSHNRLLGLDQRGCIWMDLEEKGVVCYDPARRKNSFWFSQKSDNQFGQPLSITALRTWNNLGFQGYLLKDASTAELLAGIRAVLAGRTCFDPHLDAQNAPPNDPFGDDFARRANLTFREVEIIRLVREGLNNEQIAERLSLSVFTVKTHRKNIHFKLNVSNVAELVRFAGKYGI
ncbi:MAG: LuxR C-terminal-related transcriptional regulator [Cytophagaceae bacterium]|nr:LuxR C-terminal-related transcriptional regulator [Cytophagaceae bacterium]